MGQENVQQPLEGVTFRLATVDDTSAIYAAFYSEELKEGFESWFYRALQRLEKERGFYLLAFSGEGLIGQAQLLQQGTRGEIADVQVIAAWRGLGVGTALLTRLEAVAVQYQWWPIEIVVHRDNLRARVLYERLGYQFFREMPLIREEGEAVILRKI